MFDAVTPGDHKIPGEVIHTCVSDGVPVVAGCDTERAYEIGFPTSLYASFDALRL